MKGDNKYEMTGRSPVLIPRTSARIRKRDPFLLGFPLEGFSQRYAATYRSLAENSGRRAVTHFS